MSSANYKDRDRIIQQERQIQDLKLLTTQQNVTIRKLQDENIAKSDKISALMGGDSSRGGRGGHGNMTMSSQIRTISSSHLNIRPPPKPALGNLHIG